MRRLDGKTGRAGTDGTIHLDYRLDELPSAQHRAGLAGLVLLAEWLPQPDGFQVLEVRPEGASFRVSRSGLERLFHELYGVLASPGAGRRTEPRGAFVASLEPGGAEGHGAWTRLWRDWLWTIHRGLPKAREPFEARAEGRAVRDAAEVWSELSRGGTAGGELDAGTLLGSFALNLDHVPVRGPASQRFLLHFWPYAIMVYLLRRHRSWGGRPDLDGFVAAIPDVRDLKGFCEAYPAAMRQRSAERQGPRPREALLDHPAEAALDFARRLESLTAGGPRALAYEAHHAKVHGKAMRVQAVVRLVPTSGLLVAYGAFRAMSYGDPLFRRTGIQSLVEGVPWHRGFQDVFGPAGCLRRTILSEPFRRDARMAFRVAVRNRPGTPGPEPHLEALIREAVACYVGKEVMGKFQLRMAAPQDRQAPAAEVQDKRRIVATEAFRAFQERSGPAFAEFFTASILPGAHQLGLDQALLLLRSLAQDPFQLKTLTLLALAAVA
jgi:CRISPR-associated protein Cmx8